MEQTDIVIIGCGVVGLAIASELAQSGKGKRIFILESNASFGEETSSRNSEVIHAGIYYPKDSLKAKLCVEGKGLIYALSSEYGIPTKRLGKVIVSANASEQAYLEKLLVQGKKNGVDDLRIITATELKRLEPNVAGVAALYSPSTGIVDTHRLMQFYLGQAQSKGADAVFCSTVTGISKNDRGYLVSVGSPGEDTFTFQSRVVINSAGLGSDKIAEMAGIDIDKAGYRLKFCKGQYFRVRSGMGQWVKRLVYPVPDEFSLGIHLTPDMEGGLRLGPSAHYLNQNIVNYDVDETLREEFAKDVKRFLPMLSPDRLASDTAGIRPKLQGPGEPFRDFVIKDERDRGLPGFINLIGIDSPGLTSSPAIARLVAQLVAPYY